MADNYASINGDVLPLDDAKVSVRDRGLLYGDGLYETIQARGGKCIRFDAHMARLCSGAEILRVDVTSFDFSNAVYELLAANKFSDARVRVTVTRGIRTESTVVITADLLSEYEMETSRAIISSCRRDELSPLTRVKTLNCLPSVMARMEAEAAGADDSILLNTQTNVAEGTTANVFVVKSNQLKTPSLEQGCLPGTVREAVICVAQDMGLDVEEGIVAAADLFQADELFFSSAIKLLRPIVELNRRQVGSGTHETCSKVLTALR